MIASLVVQLATPIQATAAPTPLGASSTAPTQQNAKAVAPGDTRTSLKSEQRSTDRPAGAVPDSRPVAPKPAPAPGRTTLTHPDVTPGPGAKGFDASTSRELPQRESPGTKVFANADGTQTMRMYASSQQNAGGDDTYVQPGVGDVSGEVDLDVGPARSYLHFPQFASALHSQYVDGASLVVDNIYSDNCTPSAVSVYPVAGGWSGSSLRWPGAPVNSAYSTRSFAHGAPGCDAAAWEGFPLSADDATRWTHGATFNGLSLRAADDNEANAFKRFASANSANVPYLDVTYASEGASYAVDTLTLPTNVDKGELKVRVTNMGSTTWTPSNGFTFGFTIRKNGAVVQTSPHVAPTTSVGPMGAYTFDVPVNPIAPAQYSLEMSMDNPSGQDFHAAYGVPVGTMPMTVTNVPPSMTHEEPGNGATVGTIRPTLYGDGIDHDNWPGGPLKFFYKICAGPPTAPTDCQDSGGWTGHTWTPPNPLRWSTDYTWWVQANDGAATGPAVALALTTAVQQPEITGHLAGSPDTTQGPGLDPQIGNYSTVATDASLATVGPDLTVTRTYNSLDPRKDTAFGVGWSSRVDMKLVHDNDGSQNVVVTFPTGRQVRFGANTDGSYAAPPGEAMTLVWSSGPGVWTLRDPTGWEWVFDAAGRLATIRDSAGLTETLRYDVNDHVFLITNDTSTRSLALTWTGNHVTSVRENSDGPQWTYTYDGDRLTSACAPGGACTHYTSGIGSHYRSTVLDDDPAAYWRLDEASGTTATNVTARTPGDRNGTYHGVVLGSAGAIAGTADKAATFDGSSSHVDLPDTLTSLSMSVSVELWFTTTADGVLMSYQNAAQFPSTASTEWTPLLYVGTDGLLYGGFWVPQPDKGGPRQAVSDAKVNDGKWHHAVLAASINQQILYVDGTAQQQDVNGLVDHLDQTHLELGAGRADGWPATNNGPFYFQGSIDEPAVYLHTLGSTAVAEHYRSAQSSDELTGIALPQDNRTYATLGYDDIDDRVHTLTDHDGLNWTLDNPSRNNAVRTVTLHGPYPDWTYTYDADNGGRPTWTTHGNGTEKFEYNAAGFPSKVTDQLGHVTSATTDNRGNILSRTTCRATNSCDTEYYSYFLNAADPLDPRNDKMTASSDARSASATDTKYRTTYTYDATGRLLTTTYPLSNGVTKAPVESTVYTDGTQAAPGGGAMPAGLPLQTTGKTGQVTTNAYAANGDLAQTVSPSGLHTDYTYDPLGRMTTTTTANSGDVAFGTTTYTYTQRSQVDTTTGPVVTNTVTGVAYQQVTHYDYDLDGNVVGTTISDAKGNDPQRATTYGYDAHDRLVLTNRPDGGKETTGYSADALTVTQTDANGTQWIDTYDDLQHLVARSAQGPGVDPQDPTATALPLEFRTYDDAGRLRSVTDAMNRRTDYSYYDDNLLATVTQAGVVTDQRSYDPAGNLTSEAAAGGAVTTHDYDPAGYVTRDVVDPSALNRATSYVRDADGNATQITRTGAGDPHTELVQQQFDGMDQVVRTDQQLSAGIFLSTQITRDERELPRQVTDPRQSVTQYDYDATGAQTTLTQPPVDVWQAGVKTPNVTPKAYTGYNTFGEVTQQKDANGAVTTTDRDSMGNAVATTLPNYTPPGGQPITAVTHTAYDYLGNALKVTDPLGRVSTTTYDPYGDPLTETAPQVGDDPATTVNAYDRDQELLATTSPSGSQVQATYDDLGRKVTTTEVERNPAGYYTTTNTYDDAGNLLQTKTPQGFVTKATYDAAGDKITETDPTNRVITFGYDAEGRQNSATDVSGLVTAATEDPLGRQTSVTQSKNGTLLRTWVNTYDPAGNVLSTKTPEQRATEFSYDSLNRQTSETQHPSTGTSVLMTFGYDAVGNRTHEVDGNNHATEYTFTPWGLPESTVDPATSANPDPAQRTWTTGYDADGEAVLDRSPGGVQVSRQFDAQGRVTVEHGTGAEAPTTDRTFGYDADGRTVRLGTPTGDTTYSYDDRGDLLASQGPEGHSTFTYNGDGTMASRTDAAGSASFTYDNAGRLTSESDPVTGRVATYSYDQAGRLSVVGDQSTSTVHRMIGYDDLGRVTSDTVQQSYDGGIPPRTEMGTTYGYDKGDNVTSESTNGQTSTYGYDNMSRLTSWSVQGGATTGYAWDAAGNRIQAGSTKYTYDERNELLSDGTNTFSYTPRGTSTSEGFDAFDRMVTDGSVHYSYDSLDRIAQRGSSQYQYDDLSDQEVSDGSRLTGLDPNDNPISDKASGGQGKWLYSNQHGDVTGRFLGSDASDTRAFDPFGAVTAATGDNSSLGFQGSWTDPTTGHVNMDARWYSSSTGTFLSRDSWDVPPTPTTAANRYTYGNGNPVTNADPNGHCPQCLALPVVIAVVVAVLLSLVVAKLMSPYLVSMISSLVSIIGSLIWNLVRWIESLATSDTQSGARTGTSPNDPDGPDSPCGYCSPQGDGSPNGGDNSGDGMDGLPRWLNLADRDLARPLAGSKVIKRPSTSNARTPQTKEHDQAPDKAEQFTKVTPNAGPGGGAGKSGGGGAAYTLVTHLVLQSLSNGMRQRTDQDDDGCKSSKVYGHLDSQGRATGASARYCAPGDLRGGSSAGGWIHPSGWPTSGGVYQNPEDPGGGYMYARCHLLGGQLGGDGRIRVNLVTCYHRNLNNSSMKRAENSVKAHVKRGDEVEYTVTAIYCANSSKRPDGIYLQARDDTDGSGTFLDLVLRNEYAGRGQNVTRPSQARSVICGGKSGASK